MYLPWEAWQENSLDPGNQYITPGYDPNDAPVVMTEEPASMRVSEAISDTSIPSTGYGALQLTQRH